MCVSMAMRQRRSWQGVGGHLVFGVGGAGSVVAKRAGEPMRLEQAGSILHGDMC